VLDELEVALEVVLAPSGYPAPEARGTDVMIFKILSPKNLAKKIGVFDSKQS
jgi:hypothetical protein